MEKSLLMTIFRFIPTEDKIEILNRVAPTTADKLDDAIADILLDDIENGKPYTSINFLPERLSFDYQEYYFMSNSNSDRP